MKVIGLFLGFTVALFVVGFIVYFAMNMVRTILAALFTSRRLSDPVYSGAAKTAATAVFEAASMQFFPSWLPAPARLIWCASGLVTLVIRYSLRVWWPV